ncbi:MAG: alanine racemase [Verrucomicrobiota bacterium]
MSANHRASARCWADVDLAALERNVRLIRASLPARMSYIAVVKADAYGHGLPQIAGRLMHAGVDIFGVANLTEAAALRETGADWPVLLLSPLLPGEDRRATELGCAATVSSTEEVARLDAAGAAAGRTVTVHLKIDTGMGRLGVWHEDAPALWEKICRARHLRVAGVLTHFASPDDDAIFTAEQRRRFLDTLAHCPALDPTALLIHADNSAGLETIADGGPFNAVRVGLLQFGVLPRPGSLLTAVHTEPVLSFRARIGLVKDLPAGATVSYGRTHTLQRNSTVAVLTAGYGDGVPRAASNRAQVLVRGRRCPVLGRVTMDQTVVDVTDAPGAAVNDEAVLIGRQDGVEISLAEFSAWAGTIPWETLCAITKRVPRFYHGGLGL